MHDGGSMLFKISLMRYVFIVAIICFCENLQAQENPVKHLPEHMALPLTFNDGNPEIIDIDQMEMTTGGTIRDAINRQYLAGREFILARVVTSDIYRKKDTYIHYFDAGAGDQQARGTLEKFKHEVKHLNAIGDIYFYILNPSELNPSFKFFCSWIDLVPGLPLNNYTYLFKLYYGLPDRQQLDFIKNNIAIDLYTQGLINYLLGRHYYYKGGDYIATAIRYLELAFAQKINSYAHYFAAWALGKIYYYGNGVEQNAHKAFLYYKYAAQQNIFLKLRADVNYSIGLMYYFAEGVERDAMMAHDYLQQAVFQHENTIVRSNAAYYLGLLYVNGDGIEQNVALAKKYFAIALEGHYRDEANSILLQIAWWENKSPQKRN